MNKTKLHTLTHKYLIQLIEGRMTNAQIESINKAVTLLLHKKDEVRQQETILREKIYENIRSDL